VLKLTVHSRQRLVERQIYPLRHTGYRARVGTPTDRTTAANGWLRPGSRACSRARHASSKSDG